MPSANFFDNLAKLAVGQKRVLSFLDETEMDELIRFFLPKSCTAQQYNFTFAALYYLVELCSSNPDSAKTEIGILLNAIVQQEPNLMSVFRIYVDYVNKRYAQWEQCNSSSDQTATTNDVTVYKPIPVLRTTPQASTKPQDEEQSQSPTQTAGQQTKEASKKKHASRATETKKKKTKQRRSVTKQRTAMQRLCERKHAHPKNPNYPALLSNEQERPSAKRHQQLPYRQQKITNLLHDGKRTSDQQQYYPPKPPTASRRRNKPTNKLNTLEAVKYKDCTQKHLRVLSRHQASPYYREQQLWVMNRIYNGMPSETPREPM